jgi:tetratricopeptide (TPR) repeat protein
MFLLNHKACAMKPIRLFLIILIVSALSCHDTQTKPSSVLIKEMSLKKGEIISCGPSDQKLGTVIFPVSGSKKANEDFSLGLKFLHSFEYDEAEKVFARIIELEPQCAMAYWGVAMSNFHPLWAPPSEAELKKGVKAIDLARSIHLKTPKEEGFIESIAAFYNEWEKTDHRTRCARFEKAMEKLYTSDIKDKEAAIFYALSLNAAAEPTDKTFVKQKKAGEILKALYPNEPNHPGVVHYIIHTYDSPELAELGLDAARKYASIAPSSAHALHMPSHIFTRLGIWNECIRSNVASVSSAQCYAQQAGMKGHWDEELHGLDYLVYAYLQKGDNNAARKQLKYLAAIRQVNPANFKVAYAFASMPSRYVLENKIWKAAATLELSPSNVVWENFPWQKAIFHFARALGCIHINNIQAADEELNHLRNLHLTLLKDKDNYKAGQVEIQIKTIEAWTHFKKGGNDEALRLMQLAAEMEDKTEKHPVTPGEVIPARELLGDMLFEMKKYDEALRNYELNLKKHPNRFNGLYGAGLSAEKAGKIEKAEIYYKALIRNIEGSATDRIEINTVSKFLQKNSHSGT